MAREKHALGREKAGTGWRYRKMFRGKTWTSKVYPSLTRQTKAEAWKDFTDFRDGVRLSSKPMPPISLFTSEGMIDRGTIAELGLSESEASRAMIRELCLDEYKSLAELLQHAGDRDGSQQVLTKMRWIQDTHTLTSQDLHILYQEARNLPASTLATVALPRIRQTRDSSLTTRALADEFITSYETKAKSGYGSYGQYGLVKTSLNLFVEWFGAQRSMESFERNDWKLFSAYLQKKVADGDIATATARSYQKGVSAFLISLAEEYHELIHCRTPNLSSARHRIPPKRKEPVTFTTEEIIALLQHSGERTRLYLLLMLNCAMYQQDISDLQVSEIDLEKGRIVRARSKTTKARKISDQPFLFSWQLWSTTLELLRKYSASSGTALSKSRGGSLITHTDSSRNDPIRSAYRRVVTKLKKQGILPTTWNKTLKSLRKTGSNIVSQCPRPEISAFYNQYLNHSTVAQGNYLQSGRPHAMFDEAIKYIGQQLGQEPASDPPGTPVKRKRGTRKRRPR